MRGHRGRLSSTRGVSLVLVAISMAAVMGMAALAIDLGMLLKVRAEAQRAADASALAGASAFLSNFSAAVATDSANVRANRVAGANYMAGANIDPASEVTVTVIPDSAKVRVKVRRASVGTWFAQVFGVGSVPVGAKAAAQAVSAGGALCVKPISLPDLWQDGADLDPWNRLVDSLPVAETWIWGDKAQNDYYQRFIPRLNPPTAQPTFTYPVVDFTDSNFDGTGYGTTWRGADRDWGRLLTLRDDGNAATGGNCLTTQGNKCLQPGWWALWLMPTENASDLPSLINGCRTKSTYVDSLYPTQTGQLANLQKALQDNLDADDKAQWAPGTPDAVTGQTGTVVGSSFPDWRQSPRAWIMGLFDPQTVLTDAKGQIMDVKFNNYALFWFEGCVGPGKKCGGSKTDLVGRFMGFAPGSGPGNSTLTHLLQLVE